MHATSTWPPVTAKRLLGKSENKTYKNKTNDKIKGIK